MFAVALSGCSSVTPVAGTSYPAVPVERVEVLYEEPRRPYEVISLVSHGGGSRFATIRSVVQKCRELAAASGADAVLITSTYDQTIGSAAQASGKAIKWK
jgi:acetyl esterase/lipase